MASNTSTDLDAFSALVADFPGVREVDFSALPVSISLSLEPRAQLEFARLGVLSLLSEVGGLGPGPNVEISATAPALPRKMRRSRFDSLTLAYPGRDRIAARVALEWEGEIVEGRADGERNAVNELRVAAAATLRAVERMIDDRASFNVMGVKELTVFDHHLVVVLVRSPEIDDRLIGIVVVDGDRSRAAAMAALNATNRVVGRFVDD